MNDDADRVRAEWGEVQIGTGVTRTRTPAVLTPLQAAGLDVARVDTEHSSYAPLDTRGMHGFGPHTGYRTRPPAEPMAAANARVHVTAMLETRTAFDHLDAIAAVPGIDALTPADLARDLGVLATPSPRAVLAEHRQRLAEAARRHGKAVAMLTESAEGVREMIAPGATIVNYASDAAVVRSGHAALVERVRRG
jgi:2-keto-3-deoxy-L-rhamnonate aldolase RhmA